MAATATSIGFGHGPADVHHVRPFGRPQWRGRMHTWAVAVAVPAGVQLTLSSPHGPSRIAAGVYATTLVLVFATSSAYHCATRCESSRTLMRKLDHSMIYLLIGGTFTPLCIAVLPSSWWLPMLASISAVAMFGIVMTVVAFDRLRRANYALYPVMAAVPVAIAAPRFLEQLSLSQGALIVAGGLAYSIGLPVLMTKRPDPWPERFGYHEVFHLATIVAAALHYSAIHDLLN